MKIITPLLFLCYGSSLFGQSYMTIGYAAGIPQQQMRENINPLHSLAAGIHFTIPGLGKRLQLGAEGA